MRIEVSVKYMDPEAKQWKLLISEKKDLAMPAKPDEMQNFTQEFVVPHFAIKELWWQKNVLTQLTPEDKKGIIEAYTKLAEAYSSRNIEKLVELHELKIRHLAEVLHQEPAVLSKQYAASISKQLQSCSVSTLPK